jgi:para-nitrobenzyl esterase
VTIAQADLLAGPPIDGGTVPMIIGSTHDEARLLFAADQAAFSTDAEGLRARVMLLEGKGPAEADRLIAAYKVRQPTASPSDLYFEIATDIAMRNKAVQHADRRAVTGAKTYMYRFDWRSPLFGGKYGAVHGIDIPFVFNQPDSLGAVGPDPAKVALARAVSRAWARFSWTGNPNHPGLPTWPQYTSSHRWTMLFDKKSRAIEASPIIEALTPGAGA